MTLASSSTRTSALDPSGRTVSPIAPPPRPRPTGASPSPALWRPAGRGSPRGRSCGRPSPGRSRRPAARRPRSPARPARPSGPSAAPGPGRPLWVTRHVDLREPHTPVPQLALRPCAPRAGRRRDGDHSVTLDGPCRPDRPRRAPASPSSSRAASASPWSSTSPPPPSTRCSPRRRAPHRRPRRAWRAGRLCGPAHPPRASPGPRHLDRRRARRQPRRRWSAAHPPPRRAGVDRPHVPRQLGRRPPHRRPRLHRARRRPRGALGDDQLDALRREPARSARSWPCATRPCPLRCPR